ncbi:MAG: ATP synthase F1 subunit gamma [Candidatus Omnitrophica bacterium]|nr:ATP synthase F1 subunit gamma [Candidatus Omnitrophota bacterium]
MPQPLKIIKNRIRSTENTRKVTNAMEMISVAKLNQIDKKLYAIRPYYSGFEKMFINLASSFHSADNPLFEKRKEIRNIVLCVVASDNGLCGLYNNNLFRRVEAFIREKGREKISLILVGKKGLNYFAKKNMPILHKYLLMHGKYDPFISDQITGILKHLFLAGKADEVYVGYTNFKSALIQEPVVEKFLNIDFIPGKESQYLVEPKPENLLEGLVSTYIVVNMRLIFLQAFTSEHAARSLAMRLATDNAEELIRKLTIIRNKVRQANITQEIMEVISSGEALKG